MMREAVFLADRWWDGRVGKSWRSDDLLEKEGQDALRRILPLRARTQIAGQG